MPVSTLVVNMAMRSKGFTKSAGAISGGLGRIAGKALALGAALGGVAGIGGIGLLVKNQFETIDALAKTSDKLGITTEALAGLRHAAELTGAGTKTLDTGLQRMVRRLSDAAQGTGPAVKALDELGLSAQGLAKLAPEQQFGAIADAMGGLQSEADKVRLTFALFDSEGVALKNTLAAGSAGLAEMARETFSFGLALNRVDAAKIETANDAIFRAKGVFVGLAQTIAVNLAPVIESIATRITDSADQFIRFGRKASAVIIALVNLFERWGSTLVRTIAVLGTVKLAMLSISLAQKAIAVGQALVLSLGGPAGWAVLAAGAGIAVVAIAGVNSEFQKLQQDVGNAIVGNERLGQSFGNLATQIRGVGSNSKAISLKELIEKSIPPAEKLHRELNRIARAGFQDIVKNSPQLRDALIRVFDDAIDSATGVFTKMRSVGDEILILQGRATRTGIALNDMFEKGAPRETLERLEKMMGLRDRLKAEADARGVQQQQNAGLQSEAQSIIEATRTPFETFKSSVERLEILRDKGFLDEESFLRAIEKTQKTFDSMTDNLEKPNASGGPRFASAIDVRSKEGFTAIANALAGSRRADPAKKTEENTKQINDTLKDKVVPALVDNTKAVKKIQVPKVRGFKR